MLHQYDSIGSGIEVPIALRLTGEPVDLTAKVDTGSAFCIFNREYGKQLGLTIEHGQEQWMSTVTGRFKTYGHRLTVEFFEFSFEATVYFAEDGAYQRNVLGRNGWLNQLRIAIIDHDQLLYLSSYDS